MQRKVLYTLKAENKQKYKHMHTFHQTLRHTSVPTPKRAH